MSLPRWMVLPAIGVLWNVAAAQSQFAELGRCPLESGGAIEGCRLAYRTFGTLDTGRRNAILIPTWFASRAEAWLPLLGPAGVVDTAGHFVVVVESLGAGRSSSPTTSTTQHGLAFPEITVGDMVAAEYRLVHDQLGLPELYAVVGISLGGMQAFEWGVAHPDYVRRVVPIEGGPRQGVYGQAIWELLARTSDDGARGVVPRDSTLLTLARISILGTSSPAAQNRRQPSTYPAYLAATAKGLSGIDLNEWAWHARAILRHDIARHYGGDLQRAATVWKARTLVVTSANDHSVDPQPAQEFARLIKADTLVITTAAGHMAIFGDAAAKAAVREFLKR